MASPASTPEADAITTQFLSKELGHTGDQLTFAGLLRLLKKHVSDDGEGRFNLLQSLAEFQPYTAEQADELLKTILMMRPSNDTKLQPQILLLLLIHQKLGDSGRALLHDLVRSSRDVSVRRAAARVCLDQNPADPLARNVLWDIASHALNSAPETPNDVIVEPIWATLDLLYSVDKEEAKAAILQVSQNPANLHVLGLYLTGSYSDVAGKTFLIEFVKALKEHNEDGAMQVLTMLKHFQPALYIQIADQFPWMECRSLLAQAFVHLEMEMAWKQKYPF
jgi:hypothetical protein